MTIGFVRSRHWSDILFCEVAISDLGRAAMTTRFEAYSRTPRGCRLVAIINDPARYPEYRAFSREGFPAVTALVSLVRPELEPLRRSDRREFDAAKQFVGWAVGRIMRHHGHETVGRSRVPGGLFTVGAIWSSEASQERKRNGGAAQGEHASVQIGTPQPRPQSGEPAHATL